jgi:hypothetical protein
LLAEIRKQDKEEFLSLFDGLPLEWIGTVTQKSHLTVLIHGSNVLDVALVDLITAWNTRT